MEPAPFLTPLERDEATVRSFGRAWVVDLAILPGLVGLGPGLQSTRQHFSTSGDLLWKMNTLVGDATKVGASGDDLARIEAARAEVEAARASGQHIFMETEWDSGRLLVVGKHPRDKTKFKDGNGFGTDRPPEPEPTTGPAAEDAPTPEGPPVPKNNPPVPWPVVCEMRRLFEAGGVTYHELADRFGYNGARVVNIVKYRSHLKP